jgi:hypothetical protein
MKRLPIPYILASLFICMLVCTGCNDNPTESTDPIDEVSFSQHVLPIFQQHGCISCHGGEAGLFVTSVAGLLEGGEHGPAIVPFDADNSILVGKISPNPPFGDRMPQGAPPVPPDQQNIIKQWIDEGAEDN